MITRYNSDEKVDLLLVFEDCENNVFMYVDLTTYYISIIFKPICKILKKLGFYVLSEFVVYRLFHLQKLSWSHWRNFKECNWCCT